jgi:predicted nucleic acid-binding protein
MKDPSHQPALRFLQANSLPLVTVSAVVVECCHFLALQSKTTLLQWLATDGPTVVDVPASSYGELSRIMERHADRTIDFADAALVWLAEQTGNRRILTVDAGDFSRFRLKGGRRFDLEQWRP